MGHAPIGGGPLPLPIDIATQRELDRLENRRRVMASEIAAVASDLAAHEASTIAVHGIADTSKLQIGFGTLIEGAPEFTHWAWTPDNNQDGINRGPFTQVFGGSKFGAFFDNVMGVGYNFGGAGQELAGEAAYWHALETDFWDGTKRIFESYDAYINSANTVSTRPIYVAVDRIVGDSQIAITAQGATGTIDLIATTAQLKVKPTGVDVFSGLPFTWVGAGSKTLIQAQDNAGTSTIGVIVYDAFDRILFGSSGVVNVNNQLSKLGFFNTSPLTKRTFSAAWGTARWAAVIGDALASYGLANDTTVQPRIDEVYSTSITSDCFKGDEHVITATNNTAFTVNAPTNTTQAHNLTMRIRNNSGGAMGAITWNTVFKMSAWTNPANQFSRSVTFQYDGTNWIEVSRTPSDVPF